MDSTTKFFIFMVFLSFVIGLFVIKFKKNYSMRSVYESNARYYPHITDDTVLKKIDKPKIGVPLPQAPSVFPRRARTASEPAGSSAADKSGGAQEKQKESRPKPGADGFIPD